jgi:uncharacterized membrane protein
MSFKRVSVLAGAAALLVGMASPAAAAPVIEELPLLSGTQQAMALDINDAGTAVGSSADFSGNSRAAQWNPAGTVTDLGLPAGETSGGAQGINTAGVVVGNAGRHAIRWNTGGTITILGDLAGFDTSIAFGINDSGRIYGSVSKAFSGPQTAVRWDPHPAPGPAAPQRLEPLSGDFSSWASGMNNDGVVVGYSFGWSGQEFRTRAVKWGEDRQPVVLPTFPGAVSSEAGGINNSGVIAGFVTLPGDVTHAVRWDLDGTVTDLGTLPGGISSLAADINDSGTIVGRSDGPVNPGYYVPVQWGPNGTISELGMLTNDISGQAYAINNSGVVAGESWNPLAVRWQP